MSEAGVVGTALALAEADVDVGEERPEPVLPVLAGEVVLEVRPHMPLPQSQTSQAQSRPGLGPAQTEEEVLAGLLTSEPRSSSRPTSRQSEQRVHRGATAWRVEAAGSSEPSVREVPAEVVVRREVVGGGRVVEAGRGKLGSSGGRSR